MHDGGRAYVAVGGGYRVATSTFDQTAVRHENVEDGHISSTYRFDKAPTLDVAAGVLVWRQLAAGVGVTRFSTSTPGTLSASIPHPIFFDRPRSVSGDVRDVERDELAVHVQMREILRLSERTAVALFGGPSFFRVKQGLISDLHYSETYPYDTAQFASADTAMTSKSGVGFNAGADVAFFFTRNAGVGATVQFSRANVDAPGLLGAPVRLAAGGPDVTGGLRLRF